MPAIESVIVEVPVPDVPYGLRGVGEDGVGHCRNCGFGWDRNDDVSPLPQCFDLWAKARGVPLWRLLVDLSPEQTVALLTVLRAVEEEVEEELEEELEGEEAEGAPAEDEAGSDEGE